MLLPIIPEKCMICGSSWTGGCGIPGNRFPRVGLRVFYDCGSSLSVAMDDELEHPDSHFLRLKNCMTIIPESL